MTTHKEDWNKLIDYIYTQKPEVETVERTHTVGGKETTTMVETKEFKAWNKKYKRYIDIGKK